MEGPEKNSGPSFTLLVFRGEPLDSEEPVCHDVVSLYHTGSSAGMIGGGASIWSSWMCIAGGGVLMLLLESDSGAATIGSKSGGYNSGSVEAVEEGEGGGDTLLPVDSMGARETGFFGCGRKKMESS